MDKTFVSRKPIYASNVALHAYELVSQPREHRGPLPTAAELDTLRDDLGTFTEDRLDQIVGDRQAFVNVSREAVIAGHCLSLSKRRVVLEVLDDIVSDTAFTDSITPKAVPRVTLVPTWGSSRNTMSPNCCWA